MSVSSLAVCREAWSAMSSHAFASRHCAVFGFLVALGVTLASAAMFADRLDHVGARLDFTEVLLGVLTAVAADSPELSSSVAAILRGERAVGLGVVLGSNAFNLAAMIGVGAIVAGAIRPARAWLASRRPSPCCCWW